MSRESAGPVLVCSLFCLSWCVVIACISGVCDYEAVEPDELSSATSSHSASTFLPLRSDFIAVSLQLFVVAVVWMLFFFRLVCRGLSIFAFDVGDRSTGRA